ncbi:MAG: hypothetical protein MJ180_03760 [Candidatus Gastranaerophilales bacterium]|nr:hypothetical protein [Candidatus Gastranaerophilales bacterium]
MNSIFIANAKSTLLQQASSDPNNQSIQNALNALTARETAMAQYEKTMDMQITQLENQLKVVQQRKEGAQKMVDQGAKSFNYGN